MTRYEPFMDKVDRARQLRVERKLTQKALAELMGVNPNMVNRVESRARKISVEYIEKMSKALGISEEEFAGGAPIERQGSGVLPEIMADVVYAMDETGIVADTTVSPEIKADILASLYTLAEGYRDVGHDTEQVRRELVGDAPKQMRLAIAEAKRSRS